MNLNDLKSQVALGEDSRRQFKRDVTNIGSLAAEMTAAPTANGRDLPLLQWSSMCFALR